MEKLCAICNQPFETKNSRSKFCSRDHIIACPICGKTRIAARIQLSDISKGKSIACSYECRTKKIQQTSMRKYGCKAPGNNPEARKKASETMLKNLGVPYAMMSEDIRQKSKQSLIERYGVDNAAKSAELLDKRMKTNKEKYGDTLPFNQPECYEKQHQTILRKYGVKCATYLPQLQESTPRHKSQINQEFVKRLKDVGLSVAEETRIDSKYFDIELVDKNIFIELDPTYTHSCIDHYSMKGLYPEYHKHKSELAEAHGYKCIHVWDWDNKAMIINDFLPKMNIDGSEFKVYKLSKLATDEFLNQNCIHKTCRGQLLSLGLVKDDKIYQIMTFGKCTRNEKYPIEIKRVCTRMRYSIENGYDILSRIASKEFGVDKCIMYQDASKIPDISYESIGMKFSHCTPPAKIWSKNSRFISDYWVKHPETEYTEENLLENYWLPVYDCGQNVYVFE